MIILIPFELLKLRKAMQKERSEENKAKLKSLIQNDIIGSINKNLDAGNITMSDARKLRRLVHKLYHHIYANYQELEEVTDMTDESFMLDIDIIEKEHEKQLAEVIAAKDAVIADKDAEIADKDAEIAALKAQLEQISRS